MRRQDRVQTFPIEPRNGRRREAVRPVELEATTERPLPMTLPRTLSLTAAGVLALLVATTRAAAPDTVEIRTSSLVSGGTTHWTADHIYRLHGKVVVKAGSVLDIAAGTLILGESRQDSASALVVARGGKLHAEGTASQPIIFTSELDDKAPAGAMANTNINRGQWGGVYIFGRAPNNNPGGVGDVAADVTLDTFSLRYGDSTHADPHDNSGVLSHVSIRHTGIADKSSLYGLLLASVGDSTRIEDVEVYVSAEDGIEILGGTVNLRRVASSFSAGDGIFYSAGYRGRIQNLFSIQNLIPGGASNGINAKFESSDTLIKPVSDGKVWNATFISTGDTTTHTYTGKYKYALIYKKDATGTFANSIVTEAPFGGIFVDTSKLKDAAKSRTSDSLGKSLLIHHNIWSSIGAGDSMAAVAMGVPLLATYLAANANDIEDPRLGGISWTAEKKLDPRPATSGPAYRNVASIPSDDFLVQTDYRGAFGRENWLAGWSALSRGGYFADSANVPAGISIARKGRPLAASFRDGALHLSLDRTESVDLRVLDLSGRTRSIHAFPNLSAGEHRVSVPGLSSGTWIGRLKAGSSVSDLILTRP